MIFRHFLNWVHTAPFDRRAEATRELARAYLFADLTDDDRYAAEAAMTVLLDDSHPLVRRALAETLAGHEKAPRHIILALGQDHPDIAEIVLTQAPHFLDAELVDAIAIGNTATQIAIASREAVSAAVAAALAEVGGACACAMLARNPGANVPDFSLHRLVERHGDHPEVRDAVLARPDLPVDVRQRLVAKLSAALGQMAIAQAWMGQDKAEKVVQEACDRATVSIVHDSEDGQLLVLLQHLRDSEQLTPQLLLRALCFGQRSFVVQGLAMLAGLPLARVEAMVDDRRRSGLHAVLAKSGLPHRVHGVFISGFKAFDALCLDTARQPLEITRQIIAQIEADYAEEHTGDLDDLTALLRKIASEAARDAAREFAQSCMQVLTKPERPMAEIEAA